MIWPEKDKGCMHNNKEDDACYSCSLRNEAIDDCKVAYEQTPPLVALDEKEVAKTIELTASYLHPAMNMWPNISRAICSKYGAPCLPDVHDIWVCIRALKSGGNENASDEDIAQAIHAALVKGHDPNHLFRNQ